jgi:hypothetical protein
MIQERCLIDVACLRRGQCQEYSQQIDDKCMQAGGDALEQSEEAIKQLKNIGSLSGLPPRVDAQPSDLVLEHVFRRKLLNSWAWTPKM